MDSPCYYYKRKVILHKQEGQLYQLTLLHEPKEDGERCYPCYKCALSLFNGFYCECKAQGNASDYCLCDYKTGCIAIWELINVKWVTKDEDMQ